MPATSQKFKFGLTERELDLVSSKVLHEPPFIYVDDILKAFKISDADRFEANGRSIVYVQDDNSAIIPYCPGCVIQVIYETPQSDSDSLESTTAPGTLVLLNESVDQLSIKSNFSTDLDPFGCQEKYTQKLRNMIKRAQGEFDEQLGRVIITLTSGFAAAEFYNTVSKVKGVLEFIADLRRESEALKTNSTLTTLDLSGNSIGNNGVQALAEALKTNSTLATLELQNNSIGDTGAQLLHQVSQAIRYIIGH
ncbi:hypothetical protein CPB97_003913 [Podila verticillata]|nr:hypothetical protein CPB97_003913 [Podila verticillata]